MKLLLAVLWASPLFTAATASRPLTAEAVEGDITWNGLQNVLWNFNHIAKNNGGNRAFGLPGYLASRDFVLERVQGRFGKHLKTEVQEFNHTFETMKSITLTGPDGRDVPVLPLLFSNATPLPGGLTASLIDTPVNDGRGSGCFEDQWKGIDATGKIALVKRGVCPFADKLKLAEAHGAVALIVYDAEPPKSKPATPAGKNEGADDAHGGHGHDGVDDAGKKIPIAVIAHETGLAWKKRLEAGGDVRVKLIVDSISEPRKCWNVISETLEGDPNNVILLGAHLDSVQAGPGINDDGSGSAALLEIVGSFKKFKGFPNKVRFAWWGAEESGLVGSLYYTSKLSESEADKIRFYFNYDMIGSPNASYAVYRDNDADLVGAAPLVEHLRKNNKPAEYRPFGSSSDYVGFLRLGIPSSGIFTGAGGTADPCYHKPCDDLNNINKEAMLANTKAAAYVAAKFALSLEGVPARNKTKANPRPKREVLSGKRGSGLRTFYDWEHTRDKGKPSCRDDGCEG
ncbi:hypothetical protein RJ55_07381 [Drechmeria coniospora]|nr:hypothetical protein RJ55_07381 [Drechmeria coniospora]